MNTLIKTEEFASFNVDVDIQNKSNSPIYYSEGLIEPTDVQDAYNLQPYDIVKFRIVASDATITGQTITSVTDSSGVARFNWTPGATLLIGQEVQISGYVTNTDYNGTFIVTSVGVGYFEVDSIVFGSDEATGTFDSDISVFLYNPTSIPVEVQT